MIDTRILTHCFTLVFLPLSAIAQGMSVDEAAVKPSEHYQSFKEEGTNATYRAVDATGSLVSRSDQCPWGWHSGVKSHCGHLLSYPAPGTDFTVEKTFT